LPQQAYRQTKNATRRSTTSTSTTCLTHLLTQQPREQREKTHRHTHTHTSLSHRPFSSSPAGSNAIKSKITGTLIEARVGVLCVCVWM
jgi:hypothetical protein